MTKPRPPANASIASVIKKSPEFFRLSKVLPLNALRSAAGTTANSGVYSELHPSHALYVTAINQFSVIIEALTQLPALDKLSGLINRAQKEYMPEWPPMSPLTMSFFNMWAFFDVTIGMHRESLGSIVRALAEPLKLHADFVHILELCCRSRMGLYVFEGMQGDRVLLRELVTDRKLVCINPTGYAGEPGKIWFVRVMPPPGAGFTEELIFSTPYEVEMPREAGWQNYLERVLPKNANKTESYEALLKWGSNTHYWTEYVFCAYASSQPEAIHLMGVPDVPASLPCSKINFLEKAELRQYIESGKMDRGDLS